MTLQTTTHSNEHESDSSSKGRRIVTFSVTGSAAHGRFVPLMPRHWKDVSPYVSKNYSNNDNNSIVPNLVWENAPRHETRTYRDKVSCYSHLPNGTAILDSKWVLARLLGQEPQDETDTALVSLLPPTNIDDEDEDKNDPAAATVDALATLEAHCFRGRQGFVQFCHEHNLWNNNDNDALPRAADIPDLADLKSKKSSSYTYGSGGPPPNWWVIKDASSNGAGGIWVVGPGKTARDLAHNAASPLVAGHKYVAQRYAWPCVLYAGRKTHIRVYGLLTADGQAFVHRRCFLHVANDVFLEQQQQQQCAQEGSSSPTFVDSVHITNCCANSHDKTKFAGEICATLFDKGIDRNTPRNNNATTSNADEKVKEDNRNENVDLSDFFPSIRASMATLARRTLPLLQGGMANHGFEYLGLDFILSYNEAGQPLAYLLEVNAPPSQDTATGLPHAEELHNDVLRDLLALWVIPHVEPAVSPAPGGWRQVYQHGDYPIVDDKKAVPSKAAMLNRMRWAIFEQKAAKQQETAHELRSRQRLARISLPTVARSHFDYFDQSTSSLVFWENAGGTQVPRSVIQQMTRSLQHRHRSVVGTQLKNQARQAIKTLLGATDYQVCLGTNATTLLAKVAHLYSQQGLATVGDDIVVCIENHWAHVEPWIGVASATGARMLWWDSNTDAADVLTERTRIVALTHASNVLGQVKDLSRLIRRVRQRAPLAHIIVDGVAAIPHVYANVQASDADVYVVSSHKLFGPHLGILCAKKEFLQNIYKGDTHISPHEALLEAGTMNYEACAGVQGILHYFCALGDAVNNAQSERNIDDTASRIRKAYTAIGFQESLLTRTLLEGLQRSPKVHLLSLATGDAERETRLPILSFVHESISCADLVDKLSQQGIICRHSTFLSSQPLLDRCPAFALGFVRFSLVHYNTVDEIQRVLQYLESLPDWK